MPCKADDFRTSSNSSSGDAKIFPKFVPDYIKPTPATVDPAKEMQTVEKLFKDAAGSNQEIGWMELKAILDGSIPPGKLEELHLIFVKISKLIC